MDDKEIYDLIDKKNETQFSTIESMFQGITNLITVENKDMRTSIDNLTLKVAQQNGSVKELNQWKAKHIGIHEGVEKANISNEIKKNIKWGKIFNVIMCIIGLTALLYTAFNSHDTRALTKEGNQKIDDFGSPTITNSRGEFVPLPDGYSLRMWPKDFMTDTIN